MSNKQRGIARRMAEIQPFHVMALLGRAKALESQGRDMVHMEIGEPDFETPQPIVAAGIKALEAGFHHYTPAAGLPQLRRALSDYYLKRFGVQVAPERILITPGSSSALQLLMSVLVNPGDEVLMADPGYPCNRNFVRLVEGRARSIAVNAQTKFQLTPEHIDAHWGANTCAALVASPANPTGTMINQDEMHALYQSVDAKGGVLLVDEIYQGLTYGIESETALSVSDDIFVINSFSKFFGMTGWRLGWLVAPPAYVEALEIVAQNIFLAAPTPAQHAALAAFGDDTMAILEQRRQTFRQRRDYLMTALTDLGFVITAEPQGAFYLYADCSAFTQDSYQFCIRLMEEAGVVITPGKDFGIHAPERHVRFAYTTSIERLEEGVKRLKAFLAA